MGREKKCWPRSWPDLTLGLRLFSPNVGKPPPTSNKRDKRMSEWVIRVFIFCLCWDFGSWIVCNFAVLTEQYNTIQDNDLRRELTTLSILPQPEGWLFWQEVFFSILFLFPYTYIYFLCIYVFWFVLVSIAMWEWCSDCFLYIGFD